MPEAQPSLRVRAELHFMLALFNWRLLPTSTDGVDWREMPDLPDLSDGVLTPSLKGFGWIVFEVP